MMKKKITIAGLFILLAFSSISQKNNFVTVSNSHFYINGQSYYFIGANYWYAGLVANSTEGENRIKKELDFLKKQGITNLRILGGAEGSGQINGVQRVQPPLQPTKGIFDTALLKGLDFVLSEMDKRNMKAVIYLSNNWEWSGGFLQYLNWNGLLTDSALQAKMTWDTMKETVSKFYNCEACILQYQQQVKNLVGRTNTITHKPYSTDATIMAWEIANEPRPMMPAAIDAYKNFIAGTAAYIKSLDSQHLVTTGSEGEIGSENMGVFSSVHADKNIDYATIHIWPKNWAWFKDTAIGTSFSNIVTNSDQYIKKHLAALTILNKPMVIEEFGLPRDRQSFSVLSNTSWRDKYYETIFNWLLKSTTAQQKIAGVNFWAFGGSGRPAQVWWKKGDDYLGDPPPEEQGLNTVFDCDTGTWKIIKTFTSQVNKLK